MAEFRVTVREIGQGIPLRVGEAHFVTVLFTRRVRLVGMFFDLNKCFLLPTAMNGIREIKKQYDAHPGSNLLVVGHTDTSGNEDGNLTLSLERADSIAAYLTDNADVWDVFFGEAKPQEKRWGTREIQYMLTALPDADDPFLAGGIPAADGKSGPQTDAAIRQFQQSKGLEVDGIAGPDTRKALIQAYMALDGTSLPAGITMETHGCGESFPDDATEDGVRDPENRRVEIFFFDGPITPAPPGKTSKKGATDYPQWLAQVTDTVDFSVDGSQSATSECHFSFELHDDVNDDPIANAPFKIQVPSSGDLQGQTDGSGNLQVGEVDPGDFLLEISGITMTVPSIPKSELGRRLRVRPDSPEA